MGEPLSYDDAVRVLRRGLVESSAHARAFAVRAKGRPKLISARSWQELAQIEALLSRVLAETLRHDLRVDPFTYGVRAVSMLRRIRESLRGEERLVQGLFTETRSHPVRQWREGAPQIKGELWSFFEARTEYLANTFALALNEPSPYAPLVWNPGRQEFTRRAA